MFAYYQLSWDKALDQIVPQGSILLLFAVPLGYFASRFHSVRVVAIWLFLGAILTNLAWFFTLLNPVESFLFGYGSSEGLFFEESWLVFFEWWRFLPVSLLGLVLGEVFLEVCSFFIRISRTLRTRSVNRTNV